MLGGGGGGKVIGTALRLYGTVQSQNGTGNHLPRFHSLGFRDSGVSDVSDAPDLFDVPDVPDEPILARFPRRMPFRTSKTAVMPSLGMPSVALPVLFVLFVLSGTDTETC